MRRASVAWSYWDPVCRGRSTSDKMVASRSQMRPASDGASRCFKASCPGDAARGRGAADRLRQNSRNNGESSSAAKVGSNFFSGASASFCHLEDWSWLIPSSLSVGSSRGLVRVEPTTAAHRRRDVRERAGECSPKGMVLADRRQPTGPIEVQAEEVLSSSLCPSRRLYRAFPFAFSAP